MSITNEKLQTIKDNVSKVYRSGQMDVIKNANSLKGFESNKAMLLDDVSPVTHEMGVKVKSKNLFNSDNFVQEYLATHKVLDNGQILITGASETSKLGYSEFKQFLNAGTYTISLTMTANSSGSRQMMQIWRESSYDMVYILSNYNGTAGTDLTRTITLTESKYYYFGIYGGTAKDESVYVTVQIEEGTTATVHTPYIPDLTAVKVSRYGKNLLDIQNPLSTAKDPIITYNSITATKDLTNATYQVFLVAGDYTISFIKSSYASLTITDYSGNVIYNVDSPNNVNYTFSLLTNDTLKFKIGFGRFVESGITSITVSNVQLELSSTATDYEPYISPTDYTPNADGTVNGVTSIYLNTTLMTDTDGVIIDCEYYKDVDKAYNKLSAEIALSGGE